MELVGSILKMWRKQSQVDLAEPKVVRCAIRNIDISKPFSTYCANHPHHNPDRVKIPVGPVYHNEEGHPYSRRVWVFSPDNPTVRQGLIEVLEKVPEIPWPEYPFGKPFVEEVIHQLIAFREKRAIPGLIRILSFDPLSHSDDTESAYKTTRVGTVALAAEATGHHWRNRYLARLATICYHRAGRPGGWENKRLLCRAGQVCPHPFSCGSRTPFL